MRDAARALLQNYNSCKVFGALRNDLDEIYKEGKRKNARCERHVHCGHKCGAVDDCARVVGF